MAEAGVPGSAPRRLLRADAAMALAVLLLGLLLAGMGSSLVQRWLASSARHQSLRFEDQLGIVANTAGLIVIVWWVMSAAIALAAAVLERGGRSGAASAANLYTPAFMRRLALAAVGIQLLTAPLATAAAPGVPDAGPASPVSAASWTPTAGVRCPEPPPGTTAPPAPAPASSAGVDPQWKPVAPVVEPGPLAGRQLRTGIPADRHTEVAVRIGDSLWSLSAAELGPFASDVDIAMEWPRLYRANRDVIGENPHLLQPGLVLKLPPRT